MPSLAQYLQQEFANLCPVGWQIHPEQRILPQNIEKVIGYSPRVDVLLERVDGSRRLWIEFEISRADPVANHAKFATAHLFIPQISTDTFVSMISSHVARGRQNLAANTIKLMRHIGMNAFQTTLLPKYSSVEIQRFNYYSIDRLHECKLDIVSEMERVFSVSETLTVLADRRLHFAGNIMDVMLNLHMWNTELTSASARKMWGRRTVTYFVYDPYSNNFAPSKFCAYIGVPNRENSTSMYQRTSGLEAGMTVEFYITLGDDHRFDGNRAWNHLVNNLAMRLLPPSDVPNITDKFDTWLSKYNESIALHPSGPTFVLPPVWY